MHTVPRVFIHLGRSHLKLIKAHCGAAKRSLFVRIRREKISGLIRRNNRRDIKTSRNKYKLEVEGRREKKNFPIYDSYNHLVWNTKLKASCQLVSYLIGRSRFHNMTRTNGHRPILPPQPWAPFPPYETFMDSFITNLFLIVPLPWSKPC